ncbi:MAG: methyltransferase [Bacteroidetes bacterium]|jgi:FkbM family methyltransferase|nr:methyltransferase [Bacteroidota bacterium]
MKNLFKKIYDILPFKQRVFELLRHLNLSETVYKHLHFKGIIKVPVNGKSFLMEHHGYEIENSIFWAGITGNWEKVSMKLWIELCKDSKVIFDVGANTGIYSLVAKTIQPSAAVYGFEPVERVFLKYQRNCHLNNFEVNCEKMALSNKNGEALIYDTSSEHTYSVTVNKNFVSDTELAVQTKIVTKKLSSFIQEKKITGIDLIKIDVETHEPEVLEGMEEYLQTFQPTFLIEILNDEIATRVQTLFKGMNYLFYNIDEKNPPVLVHQLVKSAHFNFLICKKEVALKLGLIK